MFRLKAQSFCVRTKYHCLLFTTEYIAPKNYNEIGPQFTSPFSYFRYVFLKCFTFATKTKLFPNETFHELFSLFSGGVVCSSYCSITFLFSALFLTFNILFFASQLFNSIINQFSTFRFSVQFNLFNPFSYQAHNSPCL